MTESTIPFESQPLLSSSISSSQLSPDETMSDSVPVFKPKHRIIFHVVQILNIGLLMTTLAFLIYSCIYIRKPGPRTYYSHFFTLYLSTCLLFQSLQVFLILHPQGRTHKKWATWIQYAYLAIITLCGLVDGISLCFTPNSDTTAIAFLVFLTGGLALFSILYLPREDHSKAHNGRTREQQSSRQRYLSTLFRIGNRILMTLHMLFLILSTSGSIQLALLYRYSNPGTRIPITLPSGQVHTISYNCTVVPSSSPLPTLWFSSSAAHGVVDFLSLQTTLAISHGRNSCSWDPPNFGWSDRLPSYLDNWEVGYDSYFSPLLSALGKEDEDMVLVGWGGGAENSLRDAIAHPNNTKALVVMDTSPDGIEWMDTRRIYNWSYAQMMDFRADDLKGRVSLAETILSLGIPWGLMPILVPANLTGFSDDYDFERFRAQGMKEDFWAFQYYTLIQEQSTGLDEYLVNNTVPEGMKVYAMMTYNASTDAASSAFYRTTKLDMVNHIAGGNLSAPIVWCLESDCSLGFPVNKPTWTAEALMSLGI